MKKKRLGCAIITALSVLTMFLTADTTGASIQAKNSNGDTWLSPEIQAECESIGGEYGICPELLEAMIETESSGSKTAQNGSCKGLMQVNAEIHADRMERLGVTDIYDEHGNILVAADYLLELFEEYEDPGLVLMKYNGVSNAESRAESGRYTAYAKKILKRSEQLERIHGK